MEVSLKIDSREGGCIALSRHGGTKMIRRNYNPDHRTEQSVDPGLEEVGIHDNGAEGSDPNAPAR